jgi:hypothetical protein
MGVYSALNFSFCTGRELFPLYLSTISRRSSKWLVGGLVWSGVRFGIGACLGGRNSRLKILLLVFVHLRMRGLDCDAMDGWEEADDGYVFMDGVHGAVMKTTT